MALPLSEYRQQLDLDHPLRVEPDLEWERSLRPVLTELGINIPDNASTRQMVEVLHGLLAPVDPHVLDEQLVARIESIAAGQARGEAVTAVTQLGTLNDESETGYPAAETVSLWVGDITRLAVDVVVNAANQQMLGCRIPNHRCIDNAIHSAAGPRLRDDCSAIIERQRSIEPVGAAKLTHAYALPARYVAHTVGPQLEPGASPTRLEQHQLESCYRSCLDVASEIAATPTIAFCGISTGLFSFPQQAAAHIALRTIAEWVDAHPGRFDRIVIDCYTPADAAVYEEILDGW